MEIDQLHYFLKVAEEASFTRAAEALTISQSALSRSIQKLESELGQPVFERQTRSLKLTQAGTLLQSRARQILDLIEDTKSQITDNGKTGRIRIGAIPTIAPYFLPPILRDFSNDFPGATLIVHEDTTENLLKACSQGDIDLAVLALPVPTKYLDVQELFEEELLVVLPQGHELDAKKRIRVVDLEPYPFILLGEAHCLTDGIVSFCRQKSFHPVSVERTNQLTTVQELVSLNHGISMIPKMARVLDLSDQRVYRSLSGPKPKRTVAVVWNPYRFQSKLLETFRESLCRLAKKER